MCFNKVEGPKTLKRHTLVKNNMTQITGDFIKKIGEIFKESEKLYETEEAYKENLELYEQLTDSLIMQNPDRAETISQNAAYLQRFVKGISICKKDERANNGGCNARFIPQFEKCADSMQNWLTGILNSFSSLHTNGFTEGCNNKIKVLKRNAYGYKNFGRFRNRILHIFSHMQQNKEQAAAYQQTACTLFVILSPYPNY